MEQKFEATSYLMEAMTDIQKAFEELQMNIESVASDRTYAVAAAQMRYVRGLLNGVIMVVNNLQECETNNVIQDVLEKWEARFENQQEVLQVMKRSYWDRSEGERDDA